MNKYVLLFIVVINIIDCALVLGELILDLHHVKRKYIYINNELHFQYNFHITILSVILIRHLINALSQFKLCF